MKIIVCLDDKNGMMFGNRRQSRDVAVTEKVISMVMDNKIWMDSYSAKLFADYSEKTQINDMFLENADDGDFCFVENRSVSQYLDKIDQIIVFRWNRHYPADQHFDVDLNENKWKIVETEDFSGKSHEKITMEIYVK